MRPSSPAFGDGAEAARSAGEAARSAGQAARSTGEDERRPPALPGSLPDGIDPLGLPTPRSQQEALVIALAAVIALLGLCFTVSWIVFNHLQTGG